MAPKNKFTKDEMVDAAIQVVRKKGINSLTAKSMADELGTSTQPIFTCFGTMDNLKSEVHAASEKIYEEYVLNGLKEKIPFFGFGTRYISFAKEEPELYRFLFLDKSPDLQNTAVKMMERSSESVRPSLIQIYNISAEEADLYFKYLWLVVHSIATLTVTNGCPYSDAEIGKILTRFSVSICKAIKEIPGFASGSFDRNAIFGDLVKK